MTAKFPAGRTGRQPKTSCQSPPSATLEPVPVRPPLKPTAGVISTHPAGPRKAGMLPLLQPRRREGWLISDYRIRELFESADVMSEGAWRPTPDGARHYFGTTSIVLPVHSAGGAIPDAQLAPLTALFLRDPHVRLRALRIACREANVRAESALGSVRAELTIVRDVHGIRIHVDVEAQSASLSAPKKVAR